MDQFEFDQSFFGDAKPIDLESILMSMEIDEVKKIEGANNFYPVYSEELQEKAVGFGGRSRDWNGGGLRWDIILCPHLQWP